MPTIQWPAQTPWPEQELWALDGGGRELVCELIRQRDMHTVVDLGSFLGGSAKRWLDASPSVTVYALENWAEGEWMAGYAEGRGKPELALRLREPNGPINVFMSALWTYRERLVPVNGWSPATLYELHATGVQPDLIYSDLKDQEESLRVAYKLFPKALFAGDDWNWSEGKGLQKRYPLRKGIRSFAREHGLKVCVRKTTWALLPKLPAKEYVYRAISAAKDAARIARDWA